MVFSIHRQYYIFPFIFALYLNVAVADGERSLTSPSSCVPFLSARIACHEEQMSSVDVDSLATLEVFPRNTTHALTLKYPRDYMFVVCARG